MDSGFVYESRLKSPCSCSEVLEHLMLRLSAVPLPGQCYNDLGILMLRIGGD